MKKISIKTLLSLMMTFIMLALAIPLTLIVSTENTEIRLLKQEKAGVEIIPQLQQVNILLAQHRGTTNRFLRGNQKVLPALKELELKIEASLNNVIIQSEKQKSHLNIPYEKLQHLQSEWRVLNTSYTTLKSKDSFKRHKDLIAHVMEFQRDISDASHLSLDNQLSTYYLMNNIVKTMPSLIEYLGQVRGFGSGLATRHQATENEKIELTKLINSVRIAMQGMSFELKRVFISLPSFQQQIEKKLFHSEQMTEIFLLMTERELINSDEISLTDDAFYFQASDVINHIMELYIPVVQKLNTELDRRINELLIKRYVILTSFMVLFIATFGFIRHITYRINKPLKHAMDCFEKINLEQYDYPIKITYQDEIGHVLQALQIMRNRLANNVADLKNMIHSLKQAQRIAQLGDWELDIKEYKLSCSEEIYHIFDLAKDKMDLDYDSFFNYIVVTDRHKIKQTLNNSLQKSGNYDVEYRINTAAGEKKIIYQRMESVTNEQGEVIQIIGILQDVTVQREMEAKIRLAARVFDHVGEAVMVTNEENKIILVNNAFSHITGYALNEVMGKDPNILKSGKHDQNFYENMWEQINNLGIWKGEVWNFRKDKSLYLEALTITTIKNNAGEVVNHVGISFDITEQKKIHDKISHLAHYDGLTELINRVAFRSQFDMAQENSEQENKRFAVLFIDLDGFKAINDYLGHDKGDEVLKITAKRLKNCVRENDIVARLGGDEFIILLPDIKEKSHVVLIAEKIVSHLKQTLRGQDKSLTVTPSIGIAIYPDDGLNYEELLNHADKAMYMAKSRGRNQYAFFND